MQGVLQALKSTYKTVQPTRLGLRYVNLISRSQLARDLGRNELNWDDIIKPAFLDMPGRNLVDLAGTKFSNEIASPLSTGDMTVRYGLLPARTEDVDFRLDIDRYSDRNLDIAQVPSLLAGFTQDIFCLFMSAAGPALLEWMTLGEES